MNGSVIFHFLNRLSWAIATVTGLLVVSHAYSQTNVFPTSGNVGIGTTSPAYNLDVVGNQGGGGNQGALRISNGSTDTGLHIVNTTVAGKDWALFSSGTGSGIGPGNFNLGVNSNGSYSPALSITANGDVGIGEINPTSMLTLSSTGADSPRILFNYANVATKNTGIQFDTGGSFRGGLFYAQDSDTLSLWTAAADRLVVDPSGNVGIGTTSPQTTLDVAGPVRGSSDVYTTGEGATRVGFLNAGGSGSGTTYFGMYYDIADNMGVISALSGGVAWRNLALDPNGGNVGIGTFDPGYPLTVNGTIRAKEVIVDTGWSDYVFGPRYHLEPLARVASYIKAHHHLQGIPTADQVKAGGVSVGQMQAKLLAKVEELTLYVVRLQKENDALKARVTALEQK